MSDEEFVEKIKEVPSKLKYKIVLSGREPENFFEKLLTRSQKFRIVRRMRNW
jgi:hypothetical protein